MNKLSSFALLACFLLTSCASSEKKEISQEERAQLYIEMASAGLNEGDATSALTYLKQAETILPKAPEVQYLLSLTYFRKNEIALSVRAAQKALQLAPNFSAAKNTLGKLYMDQGKTVEAEKYLLEAAQDLTFRDAFMAKTNLGILYYKKLKPVEAERWFSKAIFDAGDAACMASYYRGQIYLENNQLIKANADFNHASKNRCTRFSDAHLALGKTFLRMKKYEQARAKLLEVQQLFPTSDAALKANEYLREIP